MKRLLVCVILALAMVLAICAPIASAGDTYNITTKMIGEGYITILGAMPAGDNKYTIESGKLLEIDCTAAPGWVYYRGSVV